MSDISDGLDAFVAVIDAATTLDVVDDPSAIQPPCVFVDIPNVVGRTMGAVIVTVPVHLIVPGPGDKTARDALCLHIPDVLEACGESTAEAGTYSSDPGGPGLPSMTVTATLTIQRSAP
jgi:hypothetical protein